MKFKANFSDRGLKLLEKGFLPCLEKHGKTCTFLAGLEDVHLIQAPLDTDGMHVTARWAKEMLFDPASYKCASRHHNFVAFSFDVSLLLRVMRSAQTNSADVLEVKLCMRQLQASGSTQPVSKPFLAFSSRGHNLNMVQDMPVSKPLLASEIDRLNAEKDVNDVCTYYLNLQPDITRLQAMVDKLKGISQTATLVITKHGHLHLEVAAPSVHVAAELQHLQVIPATVAAEAQDLTASTAAGRMQQALSSGDGQSVALQLKHLARTLHACTAVASGQALCGIEEHGGFVHFMFVFSDPDSEAGYDDRVSLSCKLPVRADD